MTSMLKKNCSYIFKQWMIIMGTLFSGLSIILSFVSWEDLGIMEICIKAFIFIIMIVGALLVAVVWCLCRKSNVIWSDRAGKINACYGDIMKIAFPKKNHKKKIVVIPVNTCFDTIVDEDLAAHKNPLVSGKTIHGLWIKNMVKHGVSVSAIDSFIEKYIQIKEIKPAKELSKDEKCRGKLKSFDNGTVVIVDGEKNITYFLLAFSEFDKENEAQSTKENVIRCVKNLLTFYNSNGQGYDIYLTLLGTGMSRAGLSHEESFKTIKSVLMLYAKEIQGVVNIVVYSKDRDKVSIFD